MKKNNINEIVDDVYNNFNKITGYRKQDIINKEGKFINEIINDSFANIKKYIRDHYNIKHVEKTHESFLLKLDEKLLNYFL